MPGNEFSSPTKNKGKKYTETARDEGLREGDEERLVGDNVRRRDWKDLNFSTSYY